MKHLMKLFFLSLTLVMSVQGFSGALVIKPADGVSAFQMPNSLQGLTVDDIENLSIKQIEAKSGKKLKFKQKIALKIAKKNLKRAKAGKKPFDAIGFVLGLLLGLIGVLIAYLVLEKDRPGAGISSVYGVLVWIALLLILTLGILGAASSV